MTALEDLLIEENKLNMTALEDLLMTGGPPMLSY
jgi:hypothetical protein